MTLTKILGGVSGSALTVKDEGTTLSAAVTSVNFVGAGVTATNVGGAVTATIPGGAGVASLPYCAVKRAAAINPLTGSGYFSFDTETSDTSAMHDPATNPSRVTIVTSGRYIITGQWSNAVLTNVYANINIRKNGATILRDMGIGYNNSGGVQIGLSWVGDLVAGDYVELGWSVGGATQTVANGVQMEVAALAI
jgi:hypothetical protein